MDIRTGFHLQPQARHFSARMRLCLGLLAGWPIGLASAGDLASGWIALGSPAATPFHVRASTNEGPTVLIIGGLHGNEPAGAHAAEQIRHWPIRRGKLVIVPRANVVALDARTRTLKSETSTNRFDLNRAFPPVAGATNPAARLAALLWELVQTNAPTWLLDLHEGSDFRARTKQSVGSSVIASASPDARRLAEVMVKTLNASVTNTNRQFVLLKQPIKGSLARAVADELGARSMIVETTTKNQPLALRTRQHRIAVHALLHTLDMIEASVTP